MDEMHLMELCSSPGSLLSFLHGGNLLFSRLSTLCGCLQALLSNLRARRPTAVSAIASPVQSAQRLASLELTSRQLLSPRADDAVHLVKVIGWHKWR